MAALLLGGCASGAQPEKTAMPEEDEREKTLELKLAIDEEYGGLTLRWNEIPECGTYRVAVLDEGGSVLFEDRLFDTFYDGRDAVAYSAQENDHYGSVSFLVQAEGNDGEVIQEETTDPIAVTDHFPAETEISLAGREVEMFVFHESSSGSAIEEPVPDRLLNCSFSNLFGEYSFYGDMYDENGEEIETDRLLDEAEISTFLDYIRKGRYVRMRVRDPSLIVLDEDSPRSFRLELEGGTNAENRYFCFEPADSEELIAWIKTVCRK